MAQQRQMQALTWRDIQKLVPNEIDTIILPVGTVEAHGASCIGTDNYIPDSIAETIAPEINALIAPIVNHGITRSLYGYPGSTTIRPKTFIKYLMDIMHSFHHSGFKNVIILNGHGGNNDALKDVVRESNHRWKLNVAALHWWALCDEVTKAHFGDHGGHAGLDENAMVMAINPEFGFADQYSDDMVYSFVRGADIYPIPGTILTPTADGGKPRFDDIDSAKEYHKKVCAKVSEFAQFVLKRWREAGLG
jgi:creatinine amidohydrolase